MGLRPTHRDENRWLFDAAVITPYSLRTSEVLHAFLIAVSPFVATWSIERRPGHEHQTELQA